MDSSNATTWSIEAPHSLAALKQNVYIQAVFVAFAICLCTRLLTSHWYKQAKLGVGRHAEPPTLPYWIPVMKHAYSLAWDTKRFTAKCMKKYGDGTPFYIDAAGQKLLVLLDPGQIKRVMGASKELDPNPFIHNMVLGQRLGTPSETVNFYKKDNGQMDHVQMAHIRQHFTGPSLIAMTKKVYEQLKTKIDKEVSEQGSEWMDIPDLFTFVQTHVTVAITETLMGTSIIEQNPQMTADQWIFMDRSVEMLNGLPRFLMPAAYNARDRLLASLKIWSRKSEALRNEGKADSNWDPQAGSGLLQERQERYAKTIGFNEDARVSQLLGLLFAGNSITPPLSFWYLFSALSSPSLLSSVTAEISSHFSPSTSSYDLAQLTVLPILQSLHAETTRYFASNAFVRVVTSPFFALDDKYTIRKDTTLFIYTKFTGLFTPGWEEARPSTTAKPLDEFWPERFLIKGQGQARDEFSDAGLAGNWTSFGGGEHKCPGRHFARNIGIVAMAVLLGEFETELLDVEGAKGLLPEIRELAFGKMVPKGNVGARVRRRHKKVN